MADIEHKIDKALRKIYSADPGNSFNPSAHYAKIIRNQNIISILKQQGWLEQLSNMESRGLDQYRLSDTAVQRAREAIIDARWTTKAMALNSAGSWALGILVTKAFELLLS